MSLEMGPVQDSQGGVLWISRDVGMLVSPRVFQAVVW